MNDLWDLYLGDGDDDTTTDEDDDWDAGDHDGSD